MYMATQCLTRKGTEYRVTFRSTQKYTSQNHHGLRIVDSETKNLHGEDKISYCKSMTLYVS